MFTITYTGHLDSSPDAPVDLDAIVDWVAETTVDFRVTDVSLAGSELTLRMTTETSRFVRAMSEGPALVSIVVARFFGQSELGDDSRLSIRAVDA